MRLGWIALSGCLAALAGCALQSETTGVQPSEPDVYATCPDADWSLYDPQTKKQLAGANGTFVDECDANGNLIEYVCATVPDHDGYEMRELPTDQVIPKPYDCAGTCVDGRCVSHCPANDAELVFVEVFEDDSVVIEDVATGSQYDCSPTYRCDKAWYPGMPVDLWSEWGPHDLCVPGKPGSNSFRGCIYSCVAR